MVVQPPVTISIEHLVASLNHVDVDLMQHLLESGDPLLVAHGKTLAAHLNANVIMLLTWLDPIRHSAQMDCTTSEFADEIFSKLMRMNGSIALASLCADYQEVSLELSDLIHKLSPSMSLPVLEAL